MFVASAHSKMTIVILSLSSCFFFGVQHKLLVCPQQIAGGHGSLQVSKEKSDQFILLRTPCERVRALPCLQSQQG